LQTLCKLAAQVSSASRKSGKPDPLEGVREITPALLTSLSIGEAIQQNALGADCRNWIRSMLRAKEYTAAQKAAEELLGAGWEHLEKWQIADLHLTLARLYWKQGRPLQGILEVGRSVAVRPVIVARPLRRILRRFVPGLTKSKSL